MWVLLAALVVVAAVVLLRRARDGRFRTRAAGDDLRPLLTAYGERGTLLQFSSAFCAPCRTTRTVLAGMADVVPGVVHVEVDAETQLDLVRQLGILKTPTTLVLDARGHEVVRATGVPSRAAVAAALEQAVA